MQDGEKIKYVYLNMPNQIHENAISFFNEIPEEFGLLPFIYYKLQFDKGFLLPLTKVLDCIGWHTTKKITLGAFFE